ncbi:MAG TPA: DJ-1/PfpI family protein [Alphaproteobacteria bacterium]|nr:DJ-1/PfpI family protein [Alphaproteobacteria bacterium]HNS44618.1 DJ-1/PfpI family protein [Alphaproteobacteria bacterium]
MQKPLAGMNAAILVANGFNEIEMTSLQRAVLEAGGTPHIISVETSLVNGWRGNGWGLNHPVGKTISNSLAADYDLLVIPSGERSHEKLKTTAHTRRFVGGFMTAYKPVMAIGESVKLMAEIGLLSGVMVSGPETVKEAVVKEGAVWSENAPVIHHNLFSAEMTEENGTELVEGFINFVYDQYNGEDHDEHQEAA